MIDGAQQCSVFQVISGDIGGTPAARGSGVGSFRVTCNLIGCCIEFLRFPVYNYYSIHIFTVTKKYSGLVTTLFYH